ncbi:MAG: hypothetical protein AAF141_02520, partial [Pseudomonadota bacterium]
MEAKLHGAGRLIDVLATRTRRAHENLNDLPIVQADGTGNVDAGHGNLFGALSQICHRFGKLNQRGHAN